jgi:hypothetical protein
MDIHHLKQIGQIEYHTIYIDSGDRDKYVFKKPNEYEVIFDTPFTNVVGLDVLDASVVPTMYIVDEDNNSFIISIRTGGTQGTSGYSIEMYLEMLQNSKILNIAFDDVSKELQKFKIVKNHSKFYEANKNEGIFFAIFNDSAPVIAINPSNLTTDSTTSALYLGDEYGNNRTKYQVYKDGDIFTYGIEGGVASDRNKLTTVFIDGFVYGILTFTNTKNQLLTYIACKAESLVNIPLFDVINIRIVNGVPFEIEGFCTLSVSQSYYDTLDIFLHEFRRYVLHIEIGDHDITSLVSAITFVLPLYSPSGNPLENTAILNIQSISSRAPREFDRYRRLIYRARDYFWFDMKRSTISSVLGFSEIPEVGSYNYTTVKGKGNNNNNVFAAIKKGENLFELVTPGIVNLTGVRFVVLRCPQIEENGNASLSYEKYTAGLGIFKMYSTNISHLRFDFLNLKKLDMHPIGKLPKMTLRFEKADGTLYDFKGVDHHLFISIKFLKPIPNIGLVEPERRLNPDYVPDIMKFTTSYFADDLDETSTEDDEDIITNTTHRERFLTRRAIQREGRTN